MEEFSEKITDYEKLSIILNYGNACFILNGTIYHMCEYYDNVCLLLWFIVMSCDGMTVE